MIWLWFHKEACLCLRPVCASSAEDQVWCPRVAFASPNSDSPCVFSRLKRKQLILKTSWPRAQLNAVVRVHGELKRGADDADGADGAGEAGPAVPAAAH